MSDFDVINLNIQTREVTKRNFTSAEKADEVRQRKQEAADYKKIPVKKRKRARYAELDAEGMKVMREQILAILSASGEIATQDFAEYVGKIEVIKQDEGSK